MKARNLAGIAAGLVISAACSSSPPPRQQAPAPEMSGPERAAAAVRLSGDWQFALEIGGRSQEGWLHFSESRGELVGTMTGPDNNPREVSKIALKSDKVSWDVVSDYATQRFSGTIKGSSMEGTVKMSRSGGGRGGGGGATPDGESGGRSGGRRGGFGGRGGGRGGGGRGGAAEMKWKAFRSVAPTPAPAQVPEPGPTKTGV